MALAFPNTYFVGMSNLGFQTIYTLLNAEPGIVCERVFLPPKSEIAALRAAGTPIVTLESQTPVRDFDVLAFSVSFEWDYTNVLTMMTLAGVPQRAAARTRHDPLVMIGGAVTFVNPEPLALFADVIAAGEGEALVPPLVRAFEAADGRDELLRLLAAERGYYVPSFYDVLYRADGTIEAFAPKPGTGAPPVVQEGRAQDHRGGRSAGDRHLHARHRVRRPPAGGGGARLRQPVPVLLGRLQLPARARVSEGADPAAGRGGAAALGPDRPGVDRALRPPRHRGDSRTPGGDGLQHQPGLAAARRPDAHPAAAVAPERRAHHHHRAGDRVRSPAPRDQQDRDQRRDPGRLPT